MLEPGQIREAVVAALTGGKFETISQEQLQRTSRQFQPLGDGLWVGSPSWLAEQLAQHIRNYPGATPKRIEHCADNLDYNWMRPPLGARSVKLSAILANDAMANFWICKLSDGRFAAFGSRINGQRCEQSEEEKQIKADADACERYVADGKSSSIYLKAKYGQRLAVWREHAEQGMAEAQWLYGDCLLEGVGVSQDVLAAVVWFRKAAEQGLALAQMSLGNRYLLGEGVGQDTVQSIQWYRKAAAQGQPTAQAALKRLRKSSDTRRFAVRAVARSVWSRYFGWLFAKKAPPGHRESEASNVRGLPGRPQPTSEAQAGAANRHRARRDEGAERARGATTGNDPRDKPGRGLQVTTVAKSSIKLSPGRGFDLATLKSQSDVMATHRNVLNELEAIPESVAREFLSSVGVEKPWRDPAQKADQVFSNIRSNALNGPNDGTFYYLSLGHGSASAKEAIYVVHKDHKGWSSELVVCRLLDGSFLGYNEIGGIGKRLGVD